MKKAVLFDLDGTLWHTCDVILPVWNDILKKHKETTKQITLEEMNSYMGKTVEQIASIMLPELTLENSVAIVRNRFRHFAKRAVICMIILKVHLKFFQRIIFSA